MKTDIIIRTADGCVRLAPTSPETFDLVGHPDAINNLLTTLPAWEPEDNQTGSAGDGLVRLLYLAAKDDEAAPLPRLVSHKEMQDRTLLESPIVLFQIRNEWNEGEDAPEWETDRVMIDDDDVERFVEQQRHRYPAKREGVTWRSFAVPCVGRLVNVVKHARDLTNA
jgi:hypothetical protein